MTGRRAERDDGSITVLTIGLLAVVLGLVVVLVDASAVFLARRDLVSGCDTAATAAAQAADLDRVYAGGTAASALPLDRAAAARQAAGVVAQLGGGVRVTTRTTAYRATLTCTRAVRLPLVSRLGFGGGTVTVRVQSEADSPLR